MALEVRTLTTDEIGVAEQLNADAFNFSNRRDLSAWIEEAKVRYKPDWYLAAFEDGEMRAMMRIIPSHMRINGAGLGFGIVSPVAGSPLHRRRGHTGAMLRESLAVMRERGQVLSGLYTPHPMLYRRYGWEIAGDSRTVTFHPKDYAPTVEASERGKLRVVSEDEWPDLDVIFRQYSERRNGPLQRDEAWWKQWVIRGWEDRLRDVVLWEDSRGQGQGYVVYQQRGGFPQGDNISVRELVALTGDAYLNLMAFLAGHDLANEVTVRTSQDDLLRNVFSDTQKLAPKDEYTVLLRVIDFEAAMNQRRAALDAGEADVVLEIDDATAPWNSGVWLAGVREGRCFAERSQSAPEITVSATTLAMLFNGFATPAGASSAGLLRASSEDALRRAGRVFSVDHRPFFTDSF